MTKVSPTELASSNTPLGEMKIPEKIAKKHNILLITGKNMVS